MLDLSLYISSKMEKNVVKLWSYLKKSAPSILHLLHSVKSTEKISSIFVAFLENMNFNFQLTSFLTTHQIQQQIPKVQSTFSRFFWQSKLSFLLLYWLFFLQKQPDYPTRAIIICDLYFQITFKRPKTFIKEAFFLRLWPYVWLIFRSGLKSGLWWRTYGADFFGTKSCLLRPTIEDVP